MSAAFRSPGRMMSTTSDSSRKSDHHDGGGTVKPAVLLHLFVLIE
jgi:hypothetical protein